MMKTIAKHSKRKCLLNLLSVGVFATVITFTTACATSKSSNEGETFRDDNVSMQSTYQFKDVNGAQLYAAKKYGVTPIDSRAKLENNHRRLKLVESNGYYLVDRLKDSAPYLTKGAKNLLKEIGKRFQEELDKEGYREHRIIVTAMFRTRRDIAIAQQTKSSTNDNSAHLYGTTFDISFSRFNRTGTSGKAVSNETMCNILGKVIYNLREEGECWPIFERAQHCIHVTVRKI